MTTWAVDQSHSSIEFSAKHMMITTVRGKFTNWDATVVIDEANPAKSTVEVTVDLNSVSTNDDKRDGHLRSPDFFDVANYPTMTFKSKRVDFPTAGSTASFRIVGDLTIRGTTREIVLDATNEGNTRSPWGTEVYGFTAAGAINRKDWGLNWNVALEAGGWLVGEQVKIAIQLEVIKQAEAVQA